MYSNYEKGAVISSGAILDAWLNEGLVDGMDSGYACNKIVSRRRRLIAPDLTRTSQQ